MTGESEPELDIAAAQAAVLAVLDRLAPLPGEAVPLAGAVGRVLAEPLVAALDQPSAPLSIMDGYALRCADLRGDDAGPCTLPLAGESAAGHPLAQPLAPGTCARISTGAVLPSGADAVVAQEDTQRLGERVEFSPLARRELAPGRHVRAVGSDVARGELLLERGSEIGPGELALLAAHGHLAPQVLARPRLAILASGDELVAIGTTPRVGEVVATNALMLAAQIAEAGGVALDLGRVPDRHAALREAILHACEHADILVASGGISVGDHDLVLPVLRELGLTPMFRRVKLRPGRPATFGLLPRASGPALPVLALPGNPASTLVAFELLVRPLVRALLGLPRRRWFRHRARLELAAAVEGERRRDHYVRIRIDEQGRAVPLARQLSGALRSIADVDALLIVPAGRERVEPGELLEALLLR